jgi:hypothetical protein
MLMFILVAATFVAVYWFWIRPVLKSRPAFRDLYEQEESFFAALRRRASLSADTTSLRRSRAESM